MLAILATAIFLIAYALIATEKFNRVAIVCTGAAFMAIIGATDTETAFYSHETGIDWNVIFLLLGMMIIVGVIHKTGLFDFLAIKAIQLGKGKPKQSFVYILLLVAFASALLDNVTTIMLAVPMTLFIVKHLKVDPVPFILAEVFISNIGGASTLIGDPPNIIIASQADLSFNDFILNMTPIVLIVLGVVIPMLVWLFRKDLVNSEQDRVVISTLDAKKSITNQPLLTKSLIVLILVILNFIGHSITHFEPALVALLGAGLLVLISGLKPGEFARDVEWGTLVFFAGLFIMVGALVEVGAMKTLSTFIVDSVGNNPGLAATAILFVSALLSGIIDNIPYVTSMIPVIKDLVAALPPVDNDGMWWALALGADFGGNMTIVGASANVVAVGLAYANGIKITFWNFAKYGIPVTIVSVVMCYPYLLIRYF